MSGTELRPAPILLPGRNNSHPARGPCPPTLAVGKIPRGRASSQSIASREDAQLGRDVQGGEGPSRAEASGK